MYGSPRAQRFAIQMPVRYRPVENINWLEGKVENISRSGMLFRAEQLVEVNTPVEMCFELPMEAGGETGAQVICRGKIVRTILPAASDAPPALAAKILDYHFVRGQSLPEA